MTETLTVLRAHGRRLAKAVRGDGSFEDYGLARTVDLAEVEVDGLDALEALLRRLDRRPDCCVVRGAIADPARVKGVRRLLHRDGDDAPTLREVPRRWLALDFDSLPRPDWLDPTDLLGCACVAIEALPEEFRRVRFIVQATSGHGLKPGIRLRLWCWLSRPTTGAELKYWLREAPVDRSIFGAAQVIYTAAPIFLPGAFDPLPARIDVVPGDAELLVPPPRRLRPPKPRARADRDQRVESPGAEVERLAAFVARAPLHQRNASLYWAACRVAECGAARDRATALLEAAAVRAGLSAAEAVATIQSGLRHV